MAEPAPTEPVVELAALDPTRDHARRDALVHGILERLGPAAHPLAVDLARRGRWVCAIAAAVGLAAWAPTWRTPTTTAARLDPVARVVEWARTDRVPSEHELAAALELLR
jgi:hypothetical protein